LTDATTGHAKRNETNGECIDYCNPFFLFLFQYSLSTRMVFTFQERIFIVESYIRNRSYKTTREEFEQKYGAETSPWVSFLFGNLVIYRQRTTKLQYL
jgi:hypothetical protein